MSNRTNLHDIDELTETIMSELNSISSKIIRLFSQIDLMQVDRKKVRRLFKKYHRDKLKERTQHIIHREEVELSEYMELTEEAIS